MTCFVCCFVFFSLCRGILSIAWSLADPELLLSCGKDNRILCWNPNTAEVKEDCRCRFIDPASTDAPADEALRRTSPFHGRPPSEFAALIPRWCTSCPSAVSGALTSSGAPGTRRYCRPPASTDTSTSTPSWEAAARRRARDTPTRFGIKKNERVFVCEPRAVVLTCPVLLFSEMISLCLN